MLTSLFYFLGKFSKQEADLLFSRARWETSRKRPPGWPVCVDWNFMIGKWKSWDRKVRLHHLRSQILTGLRSSATVPMERERGNLIYSDTDPNKQTKEKNKTPVISLGAKRQSEKAKILGKQDLELNRLAQLHNQNQIPDKNNQYSKSIADLKAKADKAKLDGDTEQLEFILIALRTVIKKYEQNNTLLM